MTNELIEKCEVISVKFEETNAELANKATALVNKANKEDEEYCKKLSEFKYANGDLFKIANNEGSSSTTNSVGGSEDNSNDRSKVY